jgi:peptidoglycan hydrolase-like protein with peptidoglycan-binding domain
MKTPLTRVLKFGDTGEDVTNLQKMLAHMKYPVGVDGDFGAKTQAAVVDFQFHSKDSNGKSLLPDGVVGLSTWSALCGWSLVYPESSSSHDFSGALVTAAKKYVGVREDLNSEGKGLNTGVQVGAWIRSCGLEPPQPWCAAAVCAWMEEAKVASKLNIDLPRTASAQGLKDWFVSHKMHTCLEGKDIMPKAGDVGFIYFPTLGRIGHTFIISYIPGPDTVATIEGNSNEAGGRDGIGVFQRFRPVGQLCAVGRICVG